MEFFSKILRSNRSLSRQNPSFHFPIFRDFISRVSSSPLLPPSSLFSRQATAPEIPASVSDDGIETGSKPHESEKSSEITPKMNDAKKRKKRIDLFFKEAVGLIEKTEESEVSEEDSDDDAKSKGIGEVKRKLRNLERKMRNLNSIAKAKATDKKDGIGTVEAKPNSLYSLFAKPSPSANKSGAESVQMELGVCAPKDLSQEMVSFMDRLFKEGYLVDGNFMKGGKLYLNCLSSSFSQDYLKFAAERFAEDHEEIAKWLSGSDLKKVALFGCPSVERKTVFAAKSLRSFFSIHEDAVCRACKLKSSCKFANQRVVKRRKLMAADALRVLSVYGLGSVPQQLVITDEIQVSINKLLKQVVNLSK